MALGALHHHALRCPAQPFSRPSASPSLLAQIKASEAAAGAPTYERLYQRGSGTTAKRQVGAGGLTTAVRAARGAPAGAGAALGVRLLARGWRGLRRRWRALPPAASPLCCAVLHAHSHTCMLLQS